MFDRLVLAELKNLIVQELESCVSIITLGHIEDFAAYKMQAGKIMAYRKVFELFDEARENVEKRE